MRFLIGCYLGGLVLVLAIAPARAQGTGQAAPASAPLQRLRCGDMSAAEFQIQGENRPRLPQSYQTAHFVIYYTADPTSAHAPALDDTDHDGVPDYIENLGLYFEKAWSFYTTPVPDGLGYSQPPLTPGSRYPVVTYSLAEGYSGLTWPESKSGRRATSHISIDSHLYEPYVRQVAAHEFFHAVQFGYNYTASSWWKEASADWAAHQVFPDVDTYIIPYYDWFQVPDWSLAYTDGWHEYGDSIWSEYLSERRGPDLIRTIWLDQRSVNDSLVATEQALESIGTTLEAEFADFAVWNWFTGDRADGGHYRDGNLYPMIARDDQSASSMVPFSGALQPLGSQYLAIAPDDDAATTAGTRTHSNMAHIAAAAPRRTRRRVSGYLAPDSAPETPAAAPAGSVSSVQAMDITATPDARGLTVRLQAEAGVDAQLILVSTDGARTTIPLSGGRCHIPSFELRCRRVVVVLSNGDPHSKHSFSGSVGLGVVYRDQYGYVWDLELTPSGAVHGTVDVGDKAPWPVQGQISDDSFHWRAVNPNGTRGWVTGFDVSGTPGNRSATSIGWTNDAGRSDVWLGTVVDGAAPAPTSINPQGPARG